MSQHDLNIANQGFPSFREDLNNALTALGSTQSGATAPATTFANQLWYDTANNILKIRNEDNDAWISIATLDQSADTLTAIGGKTLPSGTIVGTSDSQAFTNKTFTDGTTIQGLTVGRGAGAVSSNTTVGASALATNSTGEALVAIGQDALNAHTGNNHIVAVGYQALKADTTGYYSVAVGSQSLFSNTTGNSNTAIGYQALYSNTTDGNITAVGYQALYSSTSTDNNSAFGYRALYANTTGDFNNAFGFQALVGNTTGSSNDAFGRLALYQNTTGSSNVAFGREALASNTTASNNTAVGYQAGYSNQTGANIVAVGNASAYSATGGTDLIAIGSNAYRVGTASYNTAIGFYAMGLGVVTGTQNVAIGRYTLANVTSGQNNTAVGDGSLNATTTGQYNSAYGYGSLAANTTGSNNAAFGWGSLNANTTASNNTAVGSDALEISTGTHNTGVGAFTFNSLTTGTYNTAIGAGSGDLITTGSKNTIIGRYRGNNGGLDISTASNYIVLSDGDGNPRGIFDGSGNFLVGNTSHTDGSMFQSSATALNAYRTISTPDGGIFGAYSDVGGTKTIRAYFKANGGLANYSANDTNLSDENLKKDISLANNYLDKICAIPVKNFRYKDQTDTDDVTLGVIAQDVLAVAPELVSQEGFGIDKSDKQNYLSIYQTDLQYALMKAIQELKAEVDSLKAQLNNGV